MASAKEHWAAVVEHVYDTIKAKVGEAKTDQLAGVLETIEQDLKPHIQPFIAGLADNPNVPDEVRGLLATLTEPEHFAESVVIGIAIGSIIAPVLGAATGPAVQALANTVWHGAATTSGNAGTIRPSPPLLAEAVIKGVITQAEGESIAANSGTSAADFDIMAATAGSAPGIEQGLLLLRRNQISEAEFERIVRYNNVRTDFLPDLLSLKYLPPSAGEVIMGAVKAHLTDADATTKLGEAGIDPNNYAWLKASAGRPIGLEQVLHLWNRGEASEAEVDQVIAQSDVNPTFAPLAKLLRTYVPPPRSIVPMLRSGAITVAYAEQLMTENGVRPVDAAAFIAEATKPSTAAVKELAVGQVVRGYELGTITAADATARIVAHGYSAADAALYLSIAEANRLHQLKQAAINRVRTRYVAYKIDQATAQTELNALITPPTLTAQVMTIWNEERAANVPVLTVAQYQGALHRADISTASFVGVMQARGYTPTEVGILANEAWPPSKTPPADVKALLVK